MSDKLELARKLLRLFSGNKNSHEKSNAAVRICEVIIQYDLFITDKISSLDDKVKLDRALDQIKLLEKQRESDKQNIIALKQTILRLEKEQENKRYRDYKNPIDSYDDFSFRNNSKQNYNPNEKNWPEGAFGEKVIYKWEYGVDKCNVTGLGRDKNIWVTRQGTITVVIAEEERNRFTKFTSFWFDTLDCLFAFDKQYHSSLNIAKQSVESTLKDMVKRNEW